MLLCVCCLCIGSLFLESTDKINFVVEETVKGQKKLDAKGEPLIKQTTVGVWQQWSKQLSDTSAAVLVINNGAAPTNVTVTFNKIPAFSSKKGPVKYSVRDVWNHAVLGVETTSIDVLDLASHDSAFYVVTLVNV